MKVLVVLAVLTAGGQFVALSAADVTDEGRALLRDVIERPGGYSQMCLAPPPVTREKLTFGESGTWHAATHFRIDRGRLEQLAAKRSAVVPALVEALEKIDLSKPSSTDEPLPRPWSKTRSPARPDWLSRLHLQLARGLHAVEALPPLLRLEQQVADMIATAEKAPPERPPLLDADSLLRITDLPGQDRAGHLRGALIFQADLLGTMLTLVFDARFPPALLSPMAGERRSRLLEARADAELALQREVREEAAALLEADPLAGKDGELLGRARLGKLMTVKERIEEARKRRDILARADDSDASFPLTEANRAAVRELVAKFLRSGSPVTAPPATQQPARAVAAPAPSAPNARAVKNGHVVVPIAAGTYRLGSDASRTNPVHAVELKGFWISEAETTNEQFAAFVLATGHVTDAEKDGGMVFSEGMDDWEWKKDAAANWRQPFGEGGQGAAQIPRHPVTQISGADAEAYCRWVGGRLPTVDEWEVAARAGVSTTYPWGDQFEPKKANIWNGETHHRDTRLDGFLYTAPVKSFPPNAWGLFDVIGNVFEYCAGLPAHLPPDSTAWMIAGRGGSWWCSAGTCSFYNLEEIGAMDRRGSLANQGFRVVFEEDEPAK